MIPYPGNPQLRSRQGYQSPYGHEYDIQSNEFFQTNTRPHLAPSYHGAPLLDHAPAELAIHHIQRDVSPGPRIRTLPPRAQPPVNLLPMQLHRFHDYAALQSPTYIDHVRGHIRSVPYPRYMHDEDMRMESQQDRLDEENTIEASTEAIILSEIPNTPTTDIGDSENLDGFLPPEDPVAVDANVDDYLLNFRVNQCMAFKQHKCNKHKPYICFDWHFRNQRRRRPVLRGDQTYNYSPDVYCTEYNETSGECVNGDTCPYLHRNTNDTERRYHIRYYKTQICNFETDVRTGNCTKNGAHCAYAHGVSQLRKPTFSLFTSDTGTTTMRMLGDGLDPSNFSSGIGNSMTMTPLNPHESSHTGSPVLENETSLVPLTMPTSEQDTLVGQQKEICREKIIPDDYRWEDANFVQIHYKNEKCTKPPRLCRQGYACPFYHNPRDRRRSPKVYNYKSTACPHVKIGMDWKDPNLCPEQDACEYCHTRTEQQFHQDIYKSNKCNDMQQSGYCPRGNFCAFAHVENSRSGSNASLHKSSRRQSGQNFADSLRKKISETESMDDTPNQWIRKGSKEGTMLHRHRTAPPLSLRNRIMSDSNLLSRSMVPRELSILSPIKGVSEGKPERDKGPDEIDYDKLDNHPRPLEDEFASSQISSSSGIQSRNNSANETVLKSGGYRCATVGVIRRQGLKQKMLSENWGAGSLGQGVLRRPDNLGLLSNRKSNPNSPEQEAGVKPVKHLGTGSIQIPATERQRLSNSFSTFDKAPGSLSARTSIFDQPADSYDTPRSTEPADFGFSDKLASKTDLSAKIPSSEDDRGNSSSISSTTVVSHAPTSMRSSNLPRQMSLGFDPATKATCPIGETVASMDGGLTTRFSNLSPSVKDSELERMHCDLKKKYATLQEAHSVVVVERDALSEEVAILRQKLSNSGLERDCLYKLGTEAELASMPRQNLLNIREAVKRSVNAIEEVLFADMRLEVDSAVERSTLNSRSARPHIVAGLDKSNRSFSPTSTDSKGSLQHKLTLDISQGDLHSSINSQSTSGDSMPVKFE